MHYMLLLTGDPANAPAPDYAPWAAYTQALHDAGAYVNGDPLDANDTATTVQVRDGERLVVDGPFAETKEHLIGYYVVDVPDLDSALEWAAKVPNVTWGSVEVRPVPDMGGAA